MKIIHFERDACDCLTNIRDFLIKLQQSGGFLPGPGTILECDCAMTWILREDPKLGREWVPKCQTT